ncbi:hypothetical protein P5656_05980 [Bacillus subtilis]
MRVTKNYTADGGNRTVIGGVLEIAGGKVIKDGQEVSLDGGNQAEPGPAGPKGDTGEQGPQGEKGDKGDPAVIEEGSITYEMLAEKSVRSKNIGTGSVMPEHLNSEITKVLDELKQKMNNLESDLAALKGAEEEPTE